MKLRTLLGIFSTKWKAPSSCEACGGEFICGATIAGCWCTEQKLTAEMRAELRSRYKNCLCKSCLERAVGGEVPGT